MKSISCGVIITDRKGDRLLGVVPWGRKQCLDIPKGVLESGEYPASCALRELKEETGIVLQASQLEDLGEFKYTIDKTLHLFLYRCSRLPDPASLKCISMMSNPLDPRMGTVPEVVGYEIASFQDHRFYKSLRPVLAGIQESL